MSTSFDLSIIIVSFNTRKLLRDCLSSIRKSIAGTKPETEIIVVDNGSQDGSIEMLEGDFPDVKLIKNTENVGFGKANNQAIKEAKGSYILLLNSDIVVLENSISKIYGFAKRHERSFCGGKLYNLDGSKQPSCGPFYSLPNIFIMLFLKGDTLGITRSSPEHERNVAWVSGACMIAPKQLFLKVGLFDEGIFMYMDEIDFLYRAKKMGITTWFNPHARFIHIGAASSKGRVSPVVNIFKGLSYFYRKHYGRVQYEILRVMLILKAGIAIIVGTLSGNGNLKKTYVQALAVIR